MLLAGSRRCVVYQVNDHPTSGCWETKNLHRKLTNTRVGSTTEHLITLRFSTKTYEKVSSIAAEMDLRSFPIVSIILCLIRDSQQGVHERAILRHLFEESGYNKLERPVQNESDPIQVQFGIILQQIIDVDEKNQIIHTNLWLQLKWNAENLKWNKDDFGNVSSIRVPKHMVWVPDILMYNSASDDFDQTYPTNVVITSDGSCLWVPPGMFKSTCAIDITWFPFDDQKCDLKFGSWTHEGHLLNLTQDKAEGGDITDFIRNGEWMLIGVPVKRNINEYECCPEVYIDLTFTIHIRRRTLYYGFNIIIPCVLISSLTLLLFILPPDAGEKISLGVTILLSLMVFLLLVAETMPPTSDALPLIGIYFACIMMMVSLSIVFTVCVLNFHYRSPDTHHMPGWIKNFVCTWLAWSLRMERPGVSSGRRPFVQRAQVKDFKLNPLEKSQSLVSSPAEQEEEPRLSNGNTTSFLLKVEDSMGMSSSSIRHDISCILREMRKVTAKFKKEEDENDVKNEWKFAAMVMDRLCFIICILITVGSTVAVMASAPNLITYT